jgi:hypothetical protein
MAETEHGYLEECGRRGLCPTCHEFIATRIGSGRQSDGTFCSLDCYGEWHRAVLIRRHTERVKKGRSSE